MGRVRTAIISCLSILVWQASGFDAVYAAKDQSRINTPTRSGPPPYSGPGLPGLKFEPEVRPSEPAFDDDSGDFEHGAFDSGTVNVIKTIELDADIARRALDALVEVRDKYNDAGLTEFETLEEFVAKTEAGKRLAVDIKHHGFASVTTWNAAILSVDFAYGALLEDQEADIRMQIEEVRKDSQLPEADRQMMIDSLNAMLSTPGNKNIVRVLMKDATYSEKLKQLDGME